MKKLILLFVAFILIATTISAQQEDVREHMKFGMKIGTNYSNVYDEVGEEFRANPKFGFVAGAFLGIPISEYLGFQPEFQLGQKGFKATGVLLGESYEIIRTTTYIDVPLQLAIKPIEYVTFLVGPQYSYLIKQKDEFVNTTTSIAQMQEFENDNIRKNILGITGGLDINLSNLVIGARVSWDLAHNNGDGTSTTPRYKNLWYQATIGYRIY